MSIIGLKRLQRVLTWIVVLGIALVLPADASAQDISISLGDDASLSTRTIQIFVLLTVLSLVPGIAVMITCFPFIVTVFSILRQAIGLQQSPPNMLIISLALFLTYFVMEPVFLEAWEMGGKPFSEGAITIETAFNAAIEPFRLFMANRIDPETFQQLAELREQTAQAEVTHEAPLSLLVPSFLLSEVERAFQIGFLVFLPFLVIDLVVAAILMSMGMMMVPPAIVSLPFKLAFFVVSDGWTLLSSALVRSYM